MSVKNLAAATRVIAVIAEVSWDCRYIFEGCNFPPVLTIGVDPRC